MGDATRPGSPDGPARGRSAVAVRPRTRVTRRQALRVAAGFGAVRGAGVLGVGPSRNPVTARADASPTSAPPPPATRRDDLVETLHGVDVADPYRWLEDGDSDEVRAWTFAQNARAEAVLDAVPGRAALEARLRELLRVGTVNDPRVRGRRFFYLKREQDQDQPALLARVGFGGE